MDDYPTSDSDRKSVTSPGVERRERLSQPPQLPSPKRSFLSTLIAPPQLVGQQPRTSSMSRRSSPTDSQGAGAPKRESQQRFVQFSPSLPLSITSSHPPPLSGAYPDSYQLDDFPHGSAPADYHMEELHDPFLHPHPPSDPSHPHPPAPFQEDEDPTQGMRRIQTSPSSLFSLNDPHHYAHGLRPSHPRAPQSLHQAAAAYASHVHKKTLQPDMGGAMAYDGGYYGHTGANPGTPQSQPLQATVVPARALPSGGATAGSVASLSPSSSSSSLSSMAGPTVSRGGSNASPTQQTAQQAAAAAMMEQGLRRIKSSPIALSSLAMPAAGVAGGSSKRQKTAGGDSAAPRPSTQQKAQRRLQRKAEAARASRRRKKAYVVGLEDKVAKLNAKLELVRNDHMAGLKPVERMSAVDAVHKEEQAGIKQRLLQLLQEIRLEGGGPGVSTPTSTAEGVASVTSPGSNSDSASVSGSPTLRPLSADAPSRHEELKALVDSFVSNSHKRQTSVELYFHQLEKTLIPSVAVKFALWGLSQPDDFYVNDGLWQGVMGREVGLSSDQMAELLDCRPEVTQAVNELHDVLQRMQTLRAEIKGHMEDRHKAIEDAIAVLTPQQLSAFCIWVEQNPMCMQMLETVWHTPSA